jgi:3',5'-cyclic AMP phosphodiesterase CpdA
MSELFSLAHISDLHLTPILGFGVGHWNIKRGLGYLNWARNRRLVHRQDIADRLVADLWRQGADHVAVTGDIVNLGLPDEIGAALTWLATVGTPEKVTAIPGNHDIYTRRMQGPGCTEIWRDYIAADAWGAEFAGRPPQTFPFIRRVGPLAIIGLNSAMPTRPLVAAGRIGSDQRDRLESDLIKLKAAGLICVVLIHHPPLPGQTAPRRALEDAAEMAALLTRTGADLVLHGHNHRDSLVWHPSREHPVPVVGVASGSAFRTHGPEPLARYNLYRFSSDGIEMIVRGLADANGDVVEISRGRLLPTMQPLFV